MKLSPVKKSMIAALCAALCIVLPRTLSLIPGTEGVYGALHMPVLLCAFVCGAGAGISCALLGLSLSAVITGTPTLMLLPALLAECMLGALMVSFMRGLLPFRKPGRDSAMCFGLGVISGRLAGAFVSALLFAFDGLGFFTWMGGYFVSAMPGMIVQMVLLPILVTALSEGGLISTGK